MNADDLYQAACAEKARLNEKFFFFIKVESNFLPQVYLETGKNSMYVEAPHHSHIFFLRVHDQS